MKPILFYVGMFPVYAYGFMICIGFIAAMIIAHYRLKKRGLDPSLIFDLAILCLLAGILGARIFFIAQYNHLFDFKIFYILEGISIPGAILGGIVFLACYKNTRGCFVLGIAFFVLLSFIHNDKTRLVFPMEIVWLVLVAFFAMKNAKIVLSYYSKIHGWEKFCYVFLFLLSLFIGMRGFYCYSMRSQYSWDIFALWKGGLVFLGGFFLSILGLALYCRKKQIPILPLFDVLTFSVAIALSFTRIGCFLNGCCFGKVCSEDCLLAVYFPPQAFVYDNDISKANLSHLWKKYAPEEKHFWIELPHGKKKVLNHIQEYLPPDIYRRIFRPVYATQILSSLKGIVLFFLLCWFYPKRRYEGETTIFFCIAYSIGRFSVEILRADTPPFLGTCLTAGQFLSVCIFCLCSGLFLYFRFIRTPKA